jgi:hypothetical protein
MAVDLLFYGRRRRSRGLRARSVPVRIGQHRSESVLQGHGGLPVGAVADPGVELHVRRELACPARPCITLGCTFSSTRAVMATWRRAWKVSDGSSPAR